MSLKIKKGDTVIVIAGKDKGRTGEVLRAIPDTNKVIVAGINTAKRHAKARSATDSGGIQDKDMPIPVSNVAVISPKDGKATRVGYKFTDEGKKVRISKRTGVEIP